MPILFPYLATSSLETSVQSEARIDDFRPKKETLVNWKYLKVSLKALLPKILCVFTIFHVLKNEIEMSLKETQQLVQQSIDTQGRLVKGIVTKLSAHEVGLPVLLELSSARMGYSWMFIYCNLAMLVQLIQTVPGQLIVIVSSSKIGVDRGSKNFMNALHPV